MIMKDFIKRVDWKKFVKYEVYCFMIVTILYANSILCNRNVFPENIYVIPLTVVLFAILLILKANISYLEEKIVKKQ
jgi:hypothetical protein